MRKSTKFVALDIHKDLITVALAGEDRKGPLPRGLGTERWLKHGESWVFFSEASQVILPFQGQQVFLAVIAIFAAGNHVGFGGAAAPGKRNHVVHRQLPRREPVTAIVADTGAPPVFPPLCPAKFLRLVPLAAQLFFRGRGVTRSIHRE